MIRLFAHNETDFTHNQYILKNVISCNVQEDSTGGFFLELMHPFQPEIEEGAIIKAPTPRGEQLFRIQRVKKILNSGQNVCKVYAAHIFYDLSKNFIIGVSPTYKNCQDALNMILGGTVNPTGFVGTSDITDIHSTSYERQNPVMAIIGGENSLLNTWGGCLIRDNFNVKILKEGSNKGYEIRLGKNLLGVEQDIDPSEVITRLYPTANIVSDEITTLPEKFVDSPYIGSYSQPLILEVVINLSEEEKQLPLEDIYNIMRTRARAKFAEGIDKPAIHYKIDFVHMGKMNRIQPSGTGLAQFSHDELSGDTHAELSLSVHGVAFGDPTDVLNEMNKLDLHDVVSIFINKLGIYLQASVIKYSYDSIGERFNNIELGDYEPLNRYASYMKQLDLERNLKLKANKSTVDNGTQKLTDNGMEVNMPGGGMILSTLKGARFVTTSEPNEGARLNEGLLKQLTGGDTVTARHLYGKEFQFTSEFKLWMATNHKPIIRGRDDGIWRRMHLIPFTIQIPDSKKDKHLKHKLRKELQGIMKWAVDGCLLWQRDGLKMPQAVQDAVAEYKGEMDVVAAFLDECTERGPGEVKSSELYSAYAKWATDNGEYRMSHTKFGKEVSHRYNKRKTMGVYSYDGIRLAKEFEPYNLTMSYLNK